MVMKYHHEKTKCCVVTSLVWAGAGPEHDKHLLLLRTKSSGGGDEPEATPVCLGLVDTSEWKFLEQGGARQGRQASPFLSAKPQLMSLAFLGRCQALLCMLHKQKRSIQTPCMLYSCLAASP